MHTTRTLCGTPCRLADVCTKKHEEHHDDDTLPEGESSVKRKKTSDHETYTMGESSSKQVMDEPNPLGSVSPEILEEISGNFDESSLQESCRMRSEKKIVDTTIKEANSSVSKLSKRSKGSTNEFFESRLILSEVKCKYENVTRNTGKGRKNEENVDSYEGLRRNTYDSVTP
ncbi:hypothetical protein Tco_0429721 [Tanacetum coccineum]